MRKKERELSRALQQSFDSDTPLCGPITASLAVTQYCNSKCGYCPDMRVSPFAGPTLTKIREVLDQLRDLGVQRLSITGGEPLMRQDLEEIICAAAAVDIMPLILTNGSLLTLPRAQSLRAAGATGFVVSLDALDDATYRATRGRGVADTLRGIKVLTSMKRAEPQLVVAITAVLTQKNAGQLVDLAHFVHDRGFHLQIQPCLAAPHLEISADDEALIGKIETTLEQIKEIFGERYSQSDKDYLDHVPRFLRASKVPEGFRCLAGYALVHLDAKFDLYPCWLEPPIGNLYEQSLHDLWFGSTMKNARRRIAAGHCPQCWLLCDVKPSLTYR